MDKKTDTRLGKIDIETLSYIKLHFCTKLAPPAIVEISPAAVFAKPAWIQWLWIVFHVTCGLQKGGFCSVNDMNVALRYVIGFWERGQSV
jgi:hypothetical protein